MGFSSYAAAAGAVAALAGAGVQYSAAQDSSAAAARANQQSIMSQNQAFQARQAAQRQQTQEQAAVQSASQQRYEDTQKAMRAQQDAALTQRQDTISKLNLQQQALSDQTQQQVQQTTQQQITEQALKDAQAASEAQRIAASQQAPPPTPTAASPIVQPGGAAKSALAKEMADAAAYSQDYSRRMAALGAYSAPTDTTKLATTQLGTALMPAAAADRLLKSGANALLLPSQTAYENATNYGKSAMTANTADTDENMLVTKTRASNAIDLANLQQENEKAYIQTGLNMAQARAASKKALGGGLSALGSAALLGAGAFGGGAGLFDKLGTGIGNLFDGYAWNGMATGSGLNALSGQAVSNIANASAIAPMGL